MLKIDVEPITPKLLNKQTAHYVHIKHTQDGKLVAVIPKNKDKSVRFTKPVTSSGNTIIKTTFTSNLVSNKPVLSSTRVKPSTSASGSQPSGNTKKDKIQQTPSSTQKNKVEAHPRTVKSSLKNKNCFVNMNFELLYVKCNGCMLSDNHDLCVLDFINNVNAHKKSKSVNKSSKKKVWKPTGKVFSNIGYIWRPTNLGYGDYHIGNVRFKIYYVEGLGHNLFSVGQFYDSNLKVAFRQHTCFIRNLEGVDLLTGSRGNNLYTLSLGDMMASSLICLLSKASQTKSWLWSPKLKFKKDHLSSRKNYDPVVLIGNVTISRVYYVEGLGHNLFSVGQLCDSNLEVAFCQHTCFIRNLEGVDLLTGSQGNNLYTLSFGDMMASSPKCLLSKALKTKSWLWHRRLSHLNFGAINHLARHGLVRGLPKIKFEKDHLCSACAMGKSKKKPHKSKSEDTNQEKLYLLHTDLYGLMRVVSVNGKKYILVIVDDYSRFTWVKCLRSKDEAPDFIIKFLKMIQVRLKVPVRRIRTDNKTEFVNQTLHEYYEKVGISHETSVARSPHSGPTLHEMTPATLSSGLVPNPPPSTPVDYSATEVVVPIHEVVAPVPAVSTSSPSTTNVDQDEPSPSHSQTTPETQPLVIPNDVEEENHDIEVAHMGNDPHFGIPIPEIPSDQSSLSDSIHTTVHPDH
ncbi:retrovirus-related pol polyprotein from transposon TNT 1-94 [Tanacetum coccineum]|uniref:Retrovirus-related pol polyprotein from transposon TNT 1-94 n=1 Tax=Tanacetum coccineum TaxID=301880 RepID=A0ABQ5BGY4_9ASTR